MLYTVQYSVVHWTDLRGACSEVELRIIVSPRDKFHFSEEYLAKRCSRLYGRKTVLSSFIIKFKFQIKGGADLLLPACCCCVCCWWSTDIGKPESWPFYTALPQMSDCDPTHRYVLRWFGHSVPDRPKPRPVKIIGDEIKYRHQWKIESQIRRILFRQSATMEINEVVL